MRFLVDANLSPDVARFLTAAGHDAVAVRDLGLQNAADDEILDRALLEDRQTSRRTDIERIFSSLGVDRVTLLAHPRFRPRGCHALRRADVADSACRFALTGRGYRHTRTDDL